MPNPENIEPYKMKKGQTLNPNGRPRKYVSLLKEQGYTLSQVNDSIQVLMSMDEAELKEVLDNPKATILEKTVAKAMITSLNKGSLYSMDTLLSRVYGKPRETSQITSDAKIEVVFTKGKTIL